MKGDVLLNILETVASLTAGTIVGVVDFFDILASSRYGSSYSKLSARARKIDQRRNQESFNQEIKARERQRYHSYLYKLKRDGLLIEKSKGGKKFPILTTLGRQKLRALQAEQGMCMPNISYISPTTNQFTIVAFDIPERERRKRNWLRSVLRNLGLTMIQKSVWIGKVKISEELVDDMKKMNMLEFVEIFEISRSGSLEHVI